MTSAPVHSQMIDGIAVLTLDHPPVNALAYPLRVALKAALLEAIEADDVTAIILTAKGRTFPAGADITEFDAPLLDPWIPELCTLLENSSKPTIAALHGTVLGGGFEVALACHYRIAHADTRIGLPEVTLGLLPGAGGTQRTPRLAGVVAAMDLMLRGKPVPAKAALKFRLIDAIAPDAPLMAALDMARAAPPLRPTRKRRDGLRRTDTDRAAIAARRETLNPDAPQHFAPLRILDCIEAALGTDFDQGLATERRLFDDCLESPQSQALRHAFMTERKMAKPPTKTPPHAFDSMGVIGGGAAATAMAHAALRAGLAVTLWAPDDTALAHALARVTRALDRDLAAERITRATYQALLVTLSGSADPAALGHAEILYVAPDLMVEDAPDIPAIRAEMKPGTVILLDDRARDLAPSFPTPADVICLHVPWPQGPMRLWELLPQPDTGDATLATAYALARKLGKLPLCTRSRDGSALARVLAAYRTAADHLLEAGANPAQIDTAMRAFGMPRGPFQALDEEGLDHRLPWQPPTLDQAQPRDVPIGRYLVEAGLLGRAVGHGYYVYDGPKALRESPAAQEVIDAARSSAGITPRAITDTEIQDYCATAILNAAAHILHRGDVARAADLDVALIHGLGYPRWRGGPFIAADIEGPGYALGRIWRYATDDPVFWHAAPNLEDIVRHLSSFCAQT